MTQVEFDIFWTFNFPNTLPITHFFKDDYSERWFRIHSLPESKRYAETEEEWEILLSRQNKIITDLLGDNTVILFVTGDHASEGYAESDPLDTANSIADFTFVTLPPIDLHNIMPQDYEKGQYFTPCFCEQIWRPNKFDKILKDIAKDYLRAFFISIEKKYIIAPYDGGVDIILDDTKTRDYYKDKYKLWLSFRQDGL